MAAQLKAEEINQLSQLLQNECARRKYYGSLSTNTGYGFAESPSVATNYASSAYSVNVNVNDPILTIHGENTINILLKIKNYDDIEPVVKNNVITIPDA